MVYGRERHFSGFYMWIVYCVILSQFQQAEKNKSVVKNKQEKQLEGNCVSGQGLLFCGSSLDRHATDL